MRHLIEDTRQQKGKHELKNTYWQKRGVNVIRSAMPFGDYMFAPHIVVDTKRDIYEIACDIDQDHARFRNECIKARKFGCKLVILIENIDGVVDLETLEKWEESDEHYRTRRGKRRISGMRLARAMSTMSARYGVEFQFCTPNEAGKRVIEILSSWESNDKSETNTGYPDGL